MEAAMRSIILASVLISAGTHLGRADDKNDQLPNDAPSSLSAAFDAGAAQAAQEAWAKSLRKSSAVEKNSIGMELILIPPGKFRMGSPESEQGRDKGRLADETQVAVTLTKAYYLGKTEVTRNQWRVVMGTTPWMGKEESPLAGDDCPVIEVTWDDAQAFCKRLSETEDQAYRLPTEAEWEYACRAGTTTRFSYGDDESRLGDQAWYRKNTWDRPPSGENTRGRYAHEVGRKKANPFGLHDMHGNVWEWCENGYKEQLQGGTDPVNSTGGSDRVVRGGGWPSDAHLQRSAVRIGLSRSFRSIDVGFRVARSSGQ